MKRFLLPYILLAVVAGMLSPPNGMAQGGNSSGTPRILSYQGMLADMSGTPVPDNEYVVTMRIYDTADGGVPLWEEKLRVTTYEGWFDTYLGLQKPLILPFDKRYWLAAQLQGEPEMKPRTSLVAAPYAFHSFQSDIASRAKELMPGAQGAVTSVNALQGDIVIVGTDGITVSRSGDTLRISGSAAVGTAANPIPQPVKSLKTIHPVIPTEGASGIITLGLGGSDVITVPPVSGAFQDLGTFTIGNQRIIGESVIHVTVLDKEDDGTAPNPADAIYIADVDKGEPGFFTLHLGMIPTAASSTNFQTKDTIRIGYTIVNPAR